MAQSIGDVMTTDLITVQRSASAQEAAKLMAERDIGDVIVLDGDDVFGIATDRDIVVRCVAEGIDPSACEIQSVATTNVETVSPGDPLGDAVRAMTGRSIRRVLVTDDGRPVGIVSIGDLAVEEDRRSALADVSAAPPNN